MSIFSPALSWSVFAAEDGPVTLWRDGVLAPGWTHTRAQAAGVEATGEVPHAPSALLAFGSLEAGWTHTRAQAAGVQATAEALP